MGILRVLPIQKTHIDKMANIIVLNSTTNLDIFIEIAKKHQKITNIICAYFLIFKMVILRLLFLIL